jgi:hypothetical protein
VECGRIAAMARQSSSERGPNGGVEDEVFRVRRPAVRAGGGLAVVVAAGDCRRRVPVPSYSELP